MKVQTAVFTSKRHVRYEGNELSAMACRPPQEAVAKVQSEPRRPRYIALIAQGSGRSRFVPVSELGPVLDRKWRQNLYS